MYTDNNNMNASMEQTIETIHAMRRQEELAYSSVGDYLSYLPKTTSALHNTAPPVDADCRSAMAKWCVEIANFCNYHKETAAIAMNCLDRFMSTPSGQDILLDRNLFQLAAMTALYSSVKIHEQEAMAPDLVSSLSRGVHSAQAVEAMESKMLNAIRWRVNPPTAMSFARSMMDLVPEHFMLSGEKETVAEYTKFQIETIVSEYNFCAFESSSIAFACLLNAMESITGEISYDFRTTMGNTIMVDDSTIRYLRIAIYDLLNDSDETNHAARRTMKSNLAEKASYSCADSVPLESSGIHSSPRTVTSSVPQRC